MSKRRRQGFSVLEILVALTIFAILLSLGGFQLSRYTRQLRLVESAKSLGESLSTIASEARSSSQTVTLTLSGSTLIWTNEQGISKQFTLPHGASLSAENFSGTSVTELAFTGRGFPRDGVVIFETGYSNKVKDVSMLATGLVIYP